MHRKQSEMGDADDLLLFIENTESLYRQRYLPAIKNLSKKKHKGIYDSVLASKLMMYLVEAGIEKYKQEFEEYSDVVFSKEIKQGVADDLVRKFESEFENKEYDFMKKESFSKNSLSASREEIEKEYKINEQGIITSPGKFQGEMLYIPYFWELGLEGEADDDYDDEYGAPVLGFYINDEDRTEFPELGGADYINLWESDTGFVHGEISSPKFGEKVTSSFQEDRESWWEASLEKFREDFPEYRDILDEDIEFQEDGDVYIHAGGAYPIHYRKAVPPFEPNYTSSKLSAKLTEDATKFIQKKIKKLVDEGKSQDQAVAIAYSMAREEGFDVPKKPSKKKAEREGVTFTYNPYFKSYKALREDSIQVNSIWGKMKYFFSEKEFELFKEAAQALGVDVYVLSEDSFSVKDKENPDVSKDSKVAGTYFKIEKQSDQKVAINLKQWWETELRERQKENILLELGMDADPFYYEWDNLSSKEQELLKNYHLGHSFIQKNKAHKYAGAGAWHEDEEAVINELVSAFGEEHREEMQDTLDLVGGRYSRAGAAGEVKIDGVLYNIIEDEDEAIRIAIEQVEQDAEDEPSLFSQDFLKFYLKIDDTTKRIMINEEEDVIRESVLDAIGEDSEEDMEALVEERLSAFRAGLEEPLQYFVDEQGMYTVEDLLKQTWISIDKKALAKDAVDVDGWEHFLSRYDGEYNTTKNGLVYFRAA